MDFMQILKRAWEITKTQPVLWYLGILAVFTEGGSSFGFPDFSGAFDAKKSGGAQPVWGLDDSHRESLQRVVDRLSAVDWFSAQTLVPLTILLVGSLVLYCVLIYYSAAAKAGLILAVDHLGGQPKKQLSFKKSLLAGKKYAWRILGLMALSGIFLLVCLAVLLGLFMVVIFSQGSTFSSIFLIGFIPLIILLLAFIVTAIFLGLLMKLAERSMVLHDLGIRDSVRAGYRLYRGQVGNVLLTWLVSILVHLAGGFVMLLGVLCLVPFLLLGGSLVYLGGQAAGLFIFIVFALLLLFAVILTLSGGLTTYSSAYWTISYRALEYLSQHHTLSKN